jgi:uncharacterized protein YndB with AHSA1/START domain
VDHARADQALLERRPGPGHQRRSRPAGRRQLALRDECQCGFEVAFQGEYRAIVANELIVATEVYEGMPDAGGLVTHTFTEHDGRTTLNMLVQHSCQEHRDAHINSGMEGGLREAMDHLEKVAVSLR